MTTYKTGNPIGSKDPRDLYDNAENLDTAVNDISRDTWTDRLGRSRKTMSGMERQFDAAEDYREATFDLTQADREARFNNFIASSGYQFLGDYAAGIEITEYNQIVRDSDGEFWRLSGQVELPYTTTGAGLPEDDALTPLGDAVLRQDLANPDMGAAMVARGVVAVDSIADLLALPPVQRRSDLRYLVKGYHAGSDVGGGEFYWDGASNKDSDGGIVFGDGPVGRFIRKIDLSVTSYDFGIKADASDETDKIVALLTCGISEITLSPGVFGVLGGKIYIPDGVTVRGAGIDITTIRLVDGAGAHRLNVVEMGSYAHITELTIDGNWSGNNHDANDWVTHTESPFSQGLYFGRLQTSQEGFIPAQGASFGKIKIKNTIRSGIVQTGSNNTGDTAYIENCYTDHYVYSSGAVDCVFDTIYASGAVDGGCVVFSTNSKTYSSGCGINNLYIKNPRSGNYPASRGVRYVDVRTLINRDKTESFFIGYLKIEDKGIDNQSPRLFEKNIRAQHNTSLQIGTLDADIILYDGIDFIHANYGNISIGLANIKSTGAPVSSASSLLNCSTSNPDFYPTLSVDTLLFDSSVQGNNNFRLFVCSSSRLIVKTSRLKISGGMLLRLASAIKQGVCDLGRVEVEGTASVHALITDSLGIPPSLSVDRSSSFLAVDGSGAQRVGPYGMVVFNRTTARNVYSFTEAAVGQEFYVVGDGVTTIDETSLIKNIQGQTLTLGAGEIAKYIIISGGVAKQLI